MKKKVILGFIIFSIVLLSIVFASSYEHALLREERRDYYNNNYNCEQYENCPVYNNNYCLNQNYGCRRNCGRQQEYIHTTCHK